MNTSKKHGACRRQNQTERHLESSLEGGQFVAKTKYQGLTVVIGADMTPLNKAMREARAEGTVLRTHLGSLSQLLKFNPSSTDLIARKQQLLGQAIARSTAELSLMQKAHATYAARSAELTKFEQVEWRNVQRRMHRCSSNMSV